MEKEIILEIQEQKIYIRLIKSLIARCRTSPLTANLISEKPVFLSFFFSSKLADPSLYSLRHLYDHSSHLLGKKQAKLKDCDGKHFISWNVDATGNSSFLLAEENGWFVLGTTEYFDKGIFYFNKYILDDYVCNGLMGMFQRLGANSSEICHTLVLLNGKDVKLHIHENSASHYTTFRNAALVETFETDYVKFEGFEKPDPMASLYNHAQARPLYNKLYNHFGLLECIEIDEKGHKNLH